MSQGNSRKFSMVWLVAGIAILGLCVVCGAVGVILMVSGGDEAPVAYSTEVEAPVAPILPEDTEAPQVTEAPVSEPPEAPRNDSEVYVHPSGAFQILSVSSEVAEGDNYATFYADDGTVDVTVFDLDGELSAANLEDLARQVLDVVLVQAGLAPDYQLTRTEDGQINGGYMAYMEFSANERGESEGAVYLLQDGRNLFVISLLAQDFNSVADGWAAIVDSFVVGPGQETAQAEETPAAVAGVFDSGFRPNINGFSFENYGNESGTVNLTPAEMQRMFGDTVCAAIQDNQCVLAPPAQKWMDKKNQEMDGGHCEGMAVLSSLMYTENVDPRQFGGNIAYELSVEDEDLQREIAYWWVTQMTYPGGVVKVNESPSAVVDVLKKAFGGGQQSREWWVIGIYQRDGSAGHAVTPFAVEDRGSGVYAIKIYDNNYPGEEREIVVDTNAETWEYFTSTNPSEPGMVYEGDAGTQTLEVVAISPRLSQQDCPFCKGGLYGVKGVRSLSPTQVYEIYLEGAADMLITDEAGNRLGYVEGELVNEIPGASMDTYRYGMDVRSRDFEPVYRIPVGTTFAMSVSNPSASEASTATLTLIGPGFFASLADMPLEPEETDFIGFANDGEFFGLVYLSDYTVTPAVVLGLETDEADYALWAQGTELTGEEDTLNVGVDLESGTFVLNSSDNTAPGTFDFHILRLDDQGISAFGTDGFVLEPETTVYLDYLNWPGNGAPIQVQVDYGTDGTIEETLELPDSSDEFSWE